MASAHVLVTSGDRRELWNATCVLFVVPAVWRTTSLDCCESREQSSHCIARTSDAVAPLLVSITKASRGIVLAAPAAHTAADSTSRCPQRREPRLRSVVRAARAVELWAPDVASDVCRRPPTAAATPLGCWRALAASGVAAR